MSKIMIPLVMKPQIIYRLEARKRDASGNIISRRASGDIPNVFTNHGVEVLFDEEQSQNPTSGNMGYVVGTGSSAPSINDTQLDNFISGASRQSGSDSLSFHDNEDGTGYVEFRQDALFPAGASGGNVNIAEIGAAFASSPSNSDNLCSRALVVDGNGDPSVFEWLEDEELLLTAFHRRHLSLSDIVLTNVPIDGDGPDQTVTIRPFSLGTLNNWGWPRRFTGNTFGRAFWGSTYSLPTILVNGGSSSGAGSGQQNTSQTLQEGVEPYVPGSKERTRWLRVPTGDDRNVVGFEFGGTANNAFGCWAVKLDPGIPKSDLHRCTLGLTFKIDNTP